MADGAQFPGKRDRLMATGFCICCGLTLRGRDMLATLCWKCINGLARMRRISVRLTRNAVQSGALKPAGSFQCTDCGEPAQVYDHRHYSEPLKVDPVCRSCNIRRGPAAELTMFLRCSPEMSAALFPPRKLKVVR